MSAAPEFAEPKPAFGGLRRFLGKTRAAWPALPVLIFATIIVVVDIDTGISSVSLVVVSLACGAIIVPRLITLLIRVLCGPARRDLASDITEALLVASGWIAALAVAATIFHTLGRRLPEKLAGTWLAASEWPIAVFSALVGFTIIAALVLRAPNLFARWRLSGTRRARAAIDALTAGIAWSIIIIVYLSLIHASEHVNMIVFLIAIGIVAGFALIVGLISLAALEPASGQPTGLWILLPPAKHHSQRATSVANALTKAWKHGPVTWVIPEGIAIRGVHAYLADRAGELHALHPTGSHGLEDWLRAVPAPAHWRTLPVREAHPSAQMCHEFVRRHATRSDAVVVLTDYADGLAEWMRVLAGYNLGVGWLERDLLLSPHAPPVNLPAGDFYGFLQRPMRSISRELLTELSAEIFRDAARKPRRTVIFMGPQLDNETAQSAEASAALDRCFEELRTKLAQLALGPDDLAITQGASGIEVLFMEACHLRHIPLLLVQPDEFEKRFVEPAGGTWPAHYADMVGQIPSARIRRIPLKHAPSARSRWADIRAEIVGLMSQMKPDEIHLIVAQGDGKHGHDAVASALTRALRPFHMRLHLMEIARSARAA